MTTHLSLTAGIVEIDGFIGPDEVYLCRPLGPLDGDIEWPADLGPEPAWFGVELAELLAERREEVADSNACKWTATQTFFTGIGAL